MNKTEVLERAMAIVMWGLNRFGASPFLSMVNGILDAVEESKAEGAEGWIPHNLTAAHLCRATAVLFHAELVVLADVETSGRTVKWVRITDKGRELVESVVGVQELASSGVLPRDPDSDRDLFYGDND